MCSVESDRGFGKRFRLAFGIARLHMIVSCTQFNTAPGIGYVWVVPVVKTATAGTGAIEVRLLGHAAHGMISPADNMFVPDDDIVSWAVEYVKWGINGREPRPDYPNVQQEHQQAISAGSSLSQGDIVGYGPTAYVLVSGLAFNTFPRNNVVWGVPIGRDSIMHAELISTLPKEGLRTAGVKADEEGTTTLLGQLNRIISGVPPGWKPGDATPEPSSPGRGSDDHP
jgi:hypothetical protein